MLLDELRSATQSQHQAMEGLIVPARFQSRPYYVQTVAAFEFFWRHWAPRIRQVLPDSLRAWFDRRSRHAFALQDLRALEAEPLGCGFDPCREIELDGLAAGLGSLYVLEGAALGGRLLAREAESRLGLTVDSGAAYFNGWGPQTGAHWREFADLLERESRGDPTFAASACRSAQATFAALHRTLGALLPADPPGAGGVEISGR